MYNLYLVQTVDKYGPNSFLPLAISYQWMYAQADPEVKQNWRVADVLIQKLPPEEYVSTMQEEPHMVAMSCYVWNWQYNQSLAKEIKRVFPQCEIVVGGPNVDKRNSNFFDEYPMFDIAVMGEGEPAFRTILKRKKWNRDYNDIPSVYPKGGQLCDLPARFKDLDSIPSPILSGFYDWIISKEEAKHGKQMWQVTYETLRGCPYQCTFCDIGDEYWNKITKFDMLRIQAEIDWMADNKIEYVSVCDSNWGMLKRDVEITDYVIKTKKAKGYPKFWDVTWAKANSENIFTIAKMDKDAGTKLFKGVEFAMQSLDETVQQISKRTNLKQDEALKYLNKHQDYGIPTYSELIWPMPGETLQSFKNGIQKLVELGQKSFLMVHPLVVTYNATMGQDWYLEKHGIYCKEVPLDTFYLSTDDLEGYIVEKTLAVYATDAASSRDVMIGNQFNFLFIVMYYYGWAHYIMEYMFNKHSVKHIDFITGLMDFYDDTTSLIGSELDATKKNIEAVFEDQAFWGRKIFTKDILWEYKGATSIVFHNNIDKLKQELYNFLLHTYNLDSKDLVEFNMAMCRQHKISYPFQLEVTRDVAHHCLGIDKTALVIDHWDKEVVDEKTFYHTAYHYQRKNSYWKCSFKPINKLID